MLVRITNRSIDAGALLAAVGAPGNGAALLFLGVVRDHNAGRTVAAVRYEAYTALAEPVLREIAEEASARLGTNDIAVVHRAGELGIGEASIGIAVGSPHRAEAFEACRYVIEEVKRRLPVWKHERYADGAARWVDGVTPPVPEVAGE